MARYDTVVIGGGFYGCRLALTMRERGTVCLVEREPALLVRASLLNQARVHHGYHYPRSILTSLRSRANYARFLDEYADCIDDSFPHYYAVARTMSKTSAVQFTQFCRRIDVPLEEAPKDVCGLFDGARIDAVFTVRECAFDAIALRRRLERELFAAGVDVRTSTEAVSVAAGRVQLAHESLDASLILNCTYSGIGQFAPEVAVKHELTELALVEPPPELLGAAVTVMDGPFFSLMPYPPRGLYTLSHVRYTPHWAKGYGPGAKGYGVSKANPLALGPWPVARRSHFQHMLHDAVRYLPAMRSARYVDSLWEIKTVMPRSEQDDSRPILLRETGACVTVLGAKIDSVYDVEEQILRFAQDKCSTL
jgi:glycine/D-amino acid oxidase-like deaminating enzyme